MAASPAPARRLLGVALAGVVAALGLGGLAGVAAAEAASPRVLATTIATPITPVVADHIEDGLELAERDGYDAYAIELNTPGGLVTATRDIVEDILASPVPVVVHVAPDGARAGSAGSIISLAAHVLVMAPGTTIGAATPIGLEGEEVPDKVVNDSAAQAEALAQLRGRDVDFAGDTVREGRSATVEEALELGVADARAPTLAAALEQANGRTVVVGGERRVTVATAGAQVTRFDMGFLRQVLQFLADPNIAFLLLTLGTLGLIYELTTPGVGVAGTTGAASLLLALFSLSVLPVNVVGVLLLLLAAGLFIAELFVPGTAGFAFGGAVVLVLAGVFLFEDAEGASVDLMAVLPLAVVMFVAAVVAGRIAHRTRHQPSVSTGGDSLRGRAVQVGAVRGDTGRVFADGAWWSVRSAAGPLREGEAVRVVELDGLTLVVEPMEPDPAEDRGPGRTAYDTGKDAP